MRVTAGSLRSKDTELIDINGDGLLDIIKKKKNSYNLEVWFNNGDRIEASPETVTIFDNKELKDKGSLRDWNMDGLPDRIIVKDKTA